MEKGIIALVVAALVIAAILVIVINLTSSKAKVLDMARYQSAWLAIEQAADHKNHDSLQMAILKADKLLDTAMQELATPGATMGERMKYLNKTWSHADAVWASHKLRNQIAHEAHISITVETYRRAMAGFKRALKDLGAL